MEEISHNTSLHQTAQCSTAEVSNVRVYAEE